MKSNSNQKFPVSPHTVLVLLVACSYITYTTSTHFFSIFEMVKYFIGANETKDYSHLENRTPYLWTGKLTKHKQAQNKLMNSNDQLIQIHPFLSQSIHFLISTPANVIHYQISSRNNLSNLFNILFFLKIAILTTLVAYHRPFLSL